MGRVKGVTKWSYAAIRDDAMKYTSFKEFRLNSKAYAPACHTGILKEVTEHMTSSYWDEEKVIVEARKYNTKREFRAASSGAYDYAYRNKIIDKCIEHMPPTRWTHESLMLQVKKYDNISIFRTECRGAHKYAKRKGYLDEIHETLGKPKRNITPDEKTFIYLITCDSRCKMKIGITTNKKIRFAAIKCNTPFDVKVNLSILLNRGCDAKLIERECHDLGNVIGVKQNDGSISKEWMAYDKNVISHLIRRCEEIK